MFNIIGYSNEFVDLDKQLFNLIAWIVSRKAAIKGKDGFVGLYSKALKIIQNR